MDATLFIIDIDGCVADAQARYKEAGKEPSGKKTSKAFKKWLATVMEPKAMAKDLPVPGMVELIESLHIGGAHVAFLTSRGEDRRGTTEGWLQANGFLLFGADVHMRPIGNREEDWAFKEEVIKRLAIKVQAVSVVVLDDDLSGGLSKSCKKNKWTHLKVMGYSL